MPHSRRFWFLAMLLVVPCPAFLIYCAGLLPVLALALEVVQLADVAVRDPVAIIFAAGLLLHVIVYAAVFYWVADVLSRRVSLSRFPNGQRGSVISVLAVLILVLVPMYTFDCMDGATARWCSWFELHTGWLSGDSCGDFPD